MFILDPDPDLDSLEMLDPDPDSMNIRIRNTAFKPNILFVLAPPAQTAPPAANKE
jgi:hypothetical protein